MELFGLIFVLFWVFVFTYIVALFWGSSAKENIENRFKKSDGDFYSSFSNDDDFEDTAVAFSAAYVLSDCDYDDYD